MYLNQNHSYENGFKGCEKKEPFVCLNNRNIRDNSFTEI